VQLENVKIVPNSDFGHMAPLVSKNYGRVFKENPADRRQGVTDPATAPGHEITAQPFGSSLRSG
jgi:hypothetical protein